MTKIITAGIGGVGGYFGGLLAGHYHNSDSVEVHFVARGNHLEKIRQEGLTLITRGSERIVHPASATDHPADIGIADFILICAKSYDLEAMVAQLKPCIDKHTVLLPLLNGVDSIERINAIMPATEVWNGFAYLVARLRAPGVVDNFGNIQTMYFGKDEAIDGRMFRFETLLKNAGIEATCSDDISKLMWEKFIFISPIATITSYFDINFGQLRADKSYLDQLSKLIEECISIAHAQHIALHEDIYERTMYRVQSLVPEATSSMRSDFQRDPGRTELETLSGYVVREGRRHGLSVDTYMIMYHELSRREAKKSGSAI